MQNDRQKVDFESRGHGSELFAGRRGAEAKYFMFIEY